MLAVIFLLIYTFWGLRFLLALKKIRVKNFGKSIFIGSEKNENPPIFGTFLCSEKNQSKNVELCNIKKLVILRGLQVKKKCS